MRLTSVASLLERDEQLVGLRGAADEVAGGSGGRLVSIVGQSGTGRSSLLEVAGQLAATAGLEVISAQATELESGFAFGVMRQLFERLVASSPLDRRMSLLAGSAGLAAPLFTDRGSAGHDIQEIVHGLYWLTANAAQAAARPGDGGLAMLVDDLQFADLPSLRALVYLARRVSDLPVLLVVTASAWRPSMAEDAISELLGQLRGQRLHVESLRPGSVARVVRAALGDDADTEFCEACAEATAGNPFLLAELLAELRAANLQPTAINAAEVQELVPDPVRRAVHRRLAPLTDEAREFARAAAVLRSRAKPLLVAALAGLSPDAAMRTADQLREAEILVSCDPVSFAQPLLRAAIESDIAPGERSIRHAKAASVLEDHGAGPEQIATHLLWAPADNSDHVVEILRRAAVRTMERGELETATRYLNRALDEAPNEQRRATLLIDLGEAELASGGAHAVNRLHDALGHLDDPRDRGPVWGKLGEALLSCGRHEEAARALERGLADVGDGEDPVSRQLRAKFATAAILVPSLADEWGQSVERVLASSRNDQVPGERVVLAQLAVQRAMSAAPCQAVRDLAERAWGGGALLEEEGPEGITWSLVTGALTIAGFYSVSLDIAGAVAAAAEAKGAQPAAATAWFCRSGPAHRMGLIDQAVADARRALATRDLGWAAYVGAASAVLGLALIDRDELDEAAKVTTLVDDERFADGTERAPLLDARGWLRLAERNPKAALADFEEAGRLFERVGMRVGFSFWRGGGALAALQLGRPEQARGLIAEDLRLARATQAPALIGRSLRVLGVITGPAQGIELLREAADTLALSEARIEYLAALVDLGSAMRRSGRRAQAREPLHRAIGVAGEMAARLLERRAREELRAAGGRLRSNLIDGGEGLTAGERRVTELAVQGRTNREIAQELYVTQKAVEWHLANAYRKLGISSRRELAARIAGLGGELG